jgi:hypothetical protein
VHHFQSESSASLSGPLLLCQPQGESPDAVIRPPSDGQSGHAKSLRPIRAYQMRHATRHGTARGHRGWARDIPRRRRRETLRSRRGLRRGIHSDDFQRPSLAAAPLPATVFDAGLTSLRGRLADWLSQLKGPHHYEIPSTNLKMEKLAAEEVGVCFVVLCPRQLALLHRRLTIILRGHLIATLSSP